MIESAEVFVAYVRLIGADRGRLAGSSRSIVVLCLGREVILRFSKEKDLDVTGFSCLEHCAQIDREARRAVRDRNDNMVYNSSLLQILLL